MAAPMARRIPGSSAIFFVLSTSTRGGYRTVVMQSGRMLYLLVAALLLAGAVVAGLPWTAADLARARKGYGGGSYGGGGYGKGSYKPCRRSCQVKKCRSSCGKARRTCVFCAKQDGHERMP